MENLVFAIGYAKEVVRNIRVLPLVAITGAALSLGAIARANPPDPHSDAYRVMKPYSSFVRGLKQPGTGMSCCSVADCRITERITLTKPDKRGRVHWEVFVSALNPDTGSGWRDGPNAWRVVPDKAIIHPKISESPHPPIVCWSSLHANPPPRPDQPDEEVECITLPSLG
jgi:hypothetical protein